MSMYNGKNNDFSGYFVNVFLKLKFSKMNMSGRRVQKYQLGWHNNTNMMLRSSFVLNLSDACNIFKIR